MWWVSERTSFQFFVLVSLFGIFDVLHARVKQAQEECNWGSTPNGDIPGIPGISIDKPKCIIALACIGHIIALFQEKNLLKGFEFAIPRVACLVRLAKPVQVALDSVVAAVLPEARLLLPPLVGPDFLVVWTVRIDSHPPPIFPCRFTCISLDLLSSISVYSLPSA